MITGTPIKLSTDRMIARVDGKVGWMRFNNPKRHNALSLEMWQGIAEIIEYFESNDDIRIVVMQGVGGRSFISGADISEFDRKRANAQQSATYSQTSARGSHALAEFSKPLIALIDGYCIGGGLAVALHADIRFATADSTFGIPAARLGLGYDYPGIAKLSRIVGPARARDILFSARMLTTEQAYECGIVQFIVDRESIQTEVVAYANRVANNAPLTVKAAKAAINWFEQPHSPNAAENVKKMVQACFNSNDYAEGRRAFKEKRKPNFTGT